MRVIATVLTGKQNKVKSNLKILAFIRKLGLLMGIKLHNYERFINGITWFYLLFPVQIFKYLFISSKLEESSSEIEKCRMRRW